jgi:hypothetical protein
MDTNLIILIVVVGYIFLSICRNENFNIIHADLRKREEERKKKLKKLPTTKAPKKKKKKGLFSFLTDKDEDILDDKYLDMLELTKTVNINSKYFINKQYHNEYKDVLTAIKHISDNKKKFNIESLPVEYSEHDNENDENSYKLINIFMIRLNEYINKNIILPDEVKSGWEVVYKKLGLPVLYDKEETVKNVLTVVKILNIYKFDTKNQTKYTYDIITTKDNVSDKMVLKVEMILNKINDKIIIDNVFVQGFMAEKAITYTPSNKLDYNMNESDNPNKVTDVEHIQKQLYKKYKQQLCHEKLINLNIDDTGKVFRHDLNEKMKNLKCD